MGTGMVSAERGVRLRASRLRGSARAAPRVPRCLKAGAGPETKGGE